MSKRGKRLDESMLENRIIVSLIIIASIVAIVIGYIWISNSVKKKSNLSKQLADQNSSSQSNKTTVEDKKSNEESESASTSIGKTIEESKNTNEEENTQGDTTNETASSVNNSQKTNNESSNTIENTTSEETTSTNNSINNDTNNTQNNIENQQNVSSNEENTQPSFIMPVDGEILKAFSKENLVFSETLQEWIAHQALDIKANSRDIVKCSADGTVKAIKSDPRYGLTVIVEHSSGFQTVYSNLLTAEFVVEGEQVKQGQTLGTVGNSAIFEIVDESHLHFEMLLNSEYVDPSLYINS